MIGSMNEDSNMSISGKKVLGVEDSELTEI
jgi:hypothetical protein